MYGLNPNPTLPSTNKIRGVERVSIQIDHIESEYLQPALTLTLVMVIAAEICMVESLSPMALTLPTVLRLKKIPSL